MNRIPSAYHGISPLRILGGLVLVALGLTPVYAQQPAGKQTIDITSSFKPVLRNSAKIQFNASAPRPDTSKPVLQYQVPVQNLVPGLAPVTLNPLALSVDSTASWSNTNYLKGGFGNLRTPFVEAGLSLGDQKTRFNVLANFISSNGPIDNQDYSRAAIGGQLYMPLAQNLELSGKLSYKQDRYFQYGYDQTKFSFDRKDLMNRFSTITLGGGLRNLAPTEFGLNFQPKLQVDLFSDQRSNSESSLELDAPLEKIIGEALSIRLGFNANLTRFTPDNADGINNNIYQVPVSVLFRTPNLRFQAGVTPSWDNSKFNLLPNFWVDFPIAQEKWIIQAGWISYYNKGNYQRFAAINPYLAVPTSLQNTKVQERYVGFKGTLFQNFTYNAKLGYARFNGMPLFVNDTASGKSFDILYEAQLEAFQIQGELGYVKGETFSLQAGFNLYSFTEQRVYDEPYGIVPLELKAHLRWMILKDLWLKSDLYVWQGPQYRLKNGNSDRLGGAFDLNAGLEFRITRNLQLWAQFNNITNSKYQRWNQYDAYGFNLLGGVTLQF